MSVFYSLPPPSKVIHFTSALFLPRFWFFTRFQVYLFHSFSFSPSSLSRYPHSVSLVAFRIHSFSIRRTIIYSSAAGHQAAATTAVVVVMVMVVVVVVMVVTTVVVPTAVQRHRSGGLRANGRKICAACSDDGMTGLPGPMLTTPTSADDWSNQNAGRMLLLMPTPLGTTRVADERPPVAAAATASV